MSQPDEDLTVYNIYHMTCFIDIYKSLQIYNTLSNIWFNIILHNNNITYKICIEVHIRLV